MDETHPSAPPCPPLTVTIDLTDDRDAPLELRALPTQPGVFVLEDAQHRPIQVATAGNLRRLVRSRLSAPADQDRRRAPDVRSIARRVRALPVGGRFEADWAYLQWVRRLLPATYRAMIERWEAWFIQVAPEAAFPQFTRSNRPLGRAGQVTLGPFQDRGGARRYIELLEDCFDLCRYHNILVQAPDGEACAYKEMGKCPAPCDGTVTMDAYRQQVRHAIAFARMPVRDSRNDLRDRMERASARMDFENAQRLKGRLDATAFLESAPFAHVGPMDRFRLLAVAPAERPSFARLFAIIGGRVEPLMDVDPEVAIDPMLELVASRLAAPWEAPADAIEPHEENVALVCRHLFRPRPQEVRFFTLDAIRRRRSDIASAMGDMARHEPTEP